MNKILFATEIPTAHLDELHPLVDYHFVIASECLKDPNYYSWYKNRPRDAKVMLDNGMFEEGKPLSPLELYLVASVIKPDVVFAPDVVGDAEQTLAMTKEFIELCSARRAPWKVGVIPQGANPLEIVKCHDCMVEYLLFEGPIGISFLNDRDEVVRIMNSRNSWHKDLWYHFLGLYNLQEIATWPKCVRSMDTIKPFKAAYHGFTLEECPRGLGKWDCRMNFFTGPMSSERTLYRNYAKMHQALTRR